MLQEAILYFACLIAMQMYSKFGLCLKSSSFSVLHFTFNFSSYSSFILNLNFEIQCAAKVT